MTLKIEIRVEPIKMPPPPYTNIYTIYIADLIKFRNFNLKIARFYNTVLQLILLNSSSKVTCGWLQTGLKNIYIIYIADFIKFRNFNLKICEILQHYSLANFVEFRFNNNVWVVADWVKKYMHTH